MRAKIAFPVLLLGLVVVAATLWLRPGPHTGRVSVEVPGLAESGAEANPKVKAQPPPSGIPAQVAPAAVAGPGQAPADSPEARQEAYVERRIAELEDLAADDSPGSLGVILSELTNRDPEIRKAAREAAMQFGNRDAIPRLMEAVNQTEDPQEKKELLDAIDFLRMPTPAELAQTGQGPGPMAPATGAKPPFPRR